MSFASYRPSIIVLGCDHAAYEAKERLKTFLEKEFSFTAVEPNACTKPASSHAPNLQLVDVGVQNTDSVDYPCMAGKLVHEMQRLDTLRAGTLGCAAEPAEDPVVLGVLLCGSGIGVSIAANRFPGIRAALCHNEYTARMGREHNNANVVCMGARVLGLDVMRDILKVFVTTPCSKTGNHPRRVHMLG